MFSESDSESDAGSLHRLVVNDHYAKAFAYKKEREELEKRLFVSTSIFLFFGATSDVLSGH